MGDEYAGRFFCRSLVSSIWSSWELSWWSKYLVLCFFVFSSLGLILVGGPALGRSFFRSFASYGLEYPRQHLGRRYLLGLNIGGWMALMRLQGGWVCGLQYIMREEQYACDG